MTRKMANIPCTEDCDHLPSEHALTCDDARGRWSQLEDGQMVRKWLHGVDHPRVRYVFLRHGREAVHTGSFVLEGDTATWKSMSGSVVMLSEHIVGVELLEVRPKVRLKPAVQKRRLKKVS